MEPLAHTLRPKTLDDFVGQHHLVGKGKPIAVAIEQKKIFSFILWGPPGVGKTTLARIYASCLDADIFELSAVAAGKADVAKIVDIQSKKKKILFLDEIHRFNKAQQDFLLPYVESGALFLIGATTENPSFEVNKALLSRCRVFILEQLGAEDLESIIKRTHVPYTDEVLPFLLRASSGDARQLLSIIDATVSLYGTLTLQAVKDTVSSLHIAYDKDGEEHYNLISALIKSMRASQEDAALYYLARLVAGGEDPLFIARRLVIFASEDVGNAQPTALVVANAVFDACKSVGYPECGISLAHAVSHLSRAKKDRGAYDAWRRAEHQVSVHGKLPVPLKLRNAPTKLMKELGYGDGYDMYDARSFLPEELQ